MLRAKGCEDKTGVTNYSFEAIFCVLLLKVNRYIQNETPLYITEAVDYTSEQCKSVVDRALIVNQ